MTDRVEILRERLNYDPETGDLIWVKQIGPHVRPGDEAGFIDKDGYVIVSVQNRKYHGHKVAWALHNGRWPTDGVVKLKSDSDPLLSPSERKARRTDLRITNITFARRHQADNPNANRQREFRKRRETFERRDLQVHRLKPNMVNRPNIIWHDETRRWHVYDDLSRGELIPGFPTKPRLHLKTTDLTEALTFAGDLDDMQSLLLDNPRPLDQPAYVTETMPIGMTWLHLSSFVAYDETTGIFVWRVGEGVGTRADTPYATSARRRVVIHGFRFPAHCLAWFLCKGRYPGPNDLVHLDGNESNNAIANLALDPTHKMSKSAN